MNIVVIAFSLLAMSQMQRVSGEPCQSTDAIGFKGCECNILWACDYLDSPIDGLNYKLTGYAPIGIEQFSYAKSSPNLAYLCERGAVTILYDCKGRFPLQLYLENTTVRYDTIEVETGYMKCKDTVIRRHTRERRSTARRLRLW